MSQPPLEVDTEPSPSSSGPSQSPSSVPFAPPAWGSSPAMEVRPRPPEVSPKDRSTLAFQSVGDLDIPLPEPPLPLSSSSSSSSSNPIFSWPTSMSAGQPLSLPRSSGGDPFDSTGSFSDDPFGHQSSSSSSGDDYAPSLQPMPRPTLATLGLQQAPSSLTEVRGHSEDFGRFASVAVAEQPPAFTRAISAPAPSRTDVIPRRELRPRPSAKGGHDPWHSVSVELVESLQAAIQTLLYVSPPHLLDNAKEQYSGCAIQVPATSVSALFSSMRGLNFLSSNLVPLCEGLPAGSRLIEDFDIGELVQNVADQLSGEAAQADVDLVLFHGDVGMKHVNMSGDREGIGYVLSYIVRQVLLVASKGDTIELGLQVIPQSPGMARRVSLPAVHADLDEHRLRSTSPSSKLSPAPSDTGSDIEYVCVFEIVHNVSQLLDSNVATPRAELNPFVGLAEQKQAATPKFDSALCYRLLRLVNAWLRTDTVPSSPTGLGLPRHAYELSVTLPRGAPNIDPPQLSVEEETLRQQYYGRPLPKEPSLGELADFAETLRGRKVALHASLTSIFARHLTSYLAAWGLDVSHIPLDAIEAPPSVDESQASTDPNMAKFVIIDEDVNVLRRELTRLKSDIPPPFLRQRSFRRPALYRNTRSTTRVRQSSSAIVIHFTSLDKYFQVRDVVSNLGMFDQPDILVVPKPVGPRRLLTALFTAVKQPFVDPAFSPIATSPRSPHTSGNRTPTGVVQEGFFDSVTVEVSQSDSTPKIPRSPLSEFPITTPALPSRQPSSMRLAVATPTAADVVTTPASEYFSQASGSKTPSGASGVIMQSPDGRPFGMFFEPPGRARATSSAASQRTEKAPSRRKTMSRQTSADSEMTGALSSAMGSAESSRRASAISTMSGGGTDESVRQEREPPRPPARRPTLPVAPDTKPIVAQGRARSSTVTRQQLADLKEKALPNISETQSRSKASDVVVPPINVLIVEDNPINQNILSMFFRKKKIKHQTAKDGQEAVEKWRTGSFHLILMDIQLPVMDGIEATKEIRKLEKSNHIGVFPSTPVGEQQLDQQRLADAPAASPFRSAVIIVALTASSLQTDRVAALAAGCNDFLTKPVSLKWLEKKTVEWGCMQALIDFEGWRRWRGGSDGRDPGETKRGFQVGPQEAARTVASRLRIERSKGRPVPPLLSAPDTAPSKTKTDETQTKSAAATAAATTPPHALDKPLPAKPLPALPKDRSLLPALPKE